MIKKYFEDFDIIHLYGLWQPFHNKSSQGSKKNFKKIIMSPLGALEPWSMSQKKLKKN